MNKRCVARLTDQEREKLTALVSKGKAAARKLTHARVLLKADADGPASTDEKIAEALDMGRRTVENVRKRPVEEGFEAALNRKKRCRPPREKILDGEKEARLIALACGAPPEGRKRWTLRLLSDKLVELGLDERIPDKEMPVREVAAWQRERNGKQKGVDWQLTTDDARIKLKRLYPQVGV